MAAAAAPDPTHRYRIAFACVSDDPGVRLEGLGFSCADVRTSFELAARRFPVDLSFYDNRGDRGTAVSNIDDAIRKRVDLFIEYDPDPEVNAVGGRTSEGRGHPRAGDQLSDSRCADVRRGQCSGGRDRRRGTDEVRGRELGWCGYGRGHCRRDDTD